mgnify:CR=1 FL=1
MFSLNNNINNSEKELISLKEEDSIQKNLNSFQKLKAELSLSQQEVTNLRKELELLKDSNNRLRNRNLDLLNLIKIYKSKEAQLFATEENLKNVREEYDSLKDSLLKDRANFRLELREKDNTYNQDIIQTNLRTESLKHQIDNFTGIKKLNDILYIKNTELKKNLEDMKCKEKTKLEELEIKYNKKMNNYKRKMIDFLKRNEKERAKNGTQSELNNKLNILHIQELVNEIEIQGVEVEDLLKERQELKFKILQLNRDLNIYQKVIDLIMKKNNAFQNKLKSINNNNIKEYNSLSLNKNKKNNYKAHNLLTEPDKKPLNINVIKLKKQKYRNCTHNEKFLKIIKEKYIVKKDPKNLSSADNNKEKQIFKDKSDNKENNDDINTNNKSFKYYIENKNKDKTIEFLFKEREKYKDSSQFYKDKLDTINTRFSSLIKMYNEILEKIYKEELDKNIENIILNINDFKKFNFEKMTPEQKYAILIKLINQIAPLVYKEDLESNLFIKNSSKAKEKYKINSFNVSSQNSTKTPSQITDIINLKTMSNKNNNMKNRESLGCFSDYQKFLKKEKNKTLYRFSKSKISIDLLPKVDILDL